MVCLWNLIEICKYRRDHWNSNAFKDCITHWSSFDSREGCPNVLQLQYQDSNFVSLEFWKSQFVPSYCWLDLAVSSKTSVVIKDPLVWDVHYKVIRNLWPHCMCLRTVLVTLPETPQLLVYADLVCLKSRCQLAAFHPGRACRLLWEMAGWLLVETGAIAFSCAENGHFLWDCWVPFLQQ